MSEMSNQNFENNSVNGTRPLGEGSSPGRRLLVQQREPSRHQVTARMKWNKEVKASELKDFDKKSRKTMTIYGGLHPKSDVDRLYVKKRREVEV